MAVSPFGLLASLFGIGCNHSHARSREEEFQEFVLDCRNDLETRMAKLLETYKIDQFQSFDLDQARGRLTFSDESGNRLIGTIQVVGTLSKGSNTWLWAWDSPWVVGELSADSRMVKDHGVRHGFAALTTGKWKADESDAWAMTAVTAKLASAEGAYRVPNRQSLIYMVIKTLESLPRDSGPGESRPVRIT